MLLLKERIASILKDGSLPKDDEFLSGFLTADGLQFDVQETTYWDFKDEFPFSFSNEYFGGILKLICGFHNTYGGLIIFGVHDTKRTPGHNKVLSNIEKLNSVIREKLSYPFECIHRKYVLSAYEDPDGGAVDVIMVPKRPFGTPPVRFAVGIGNKYPAGHIYIRKNHEVLKATSDDLLFLYGGRDSYGVFQEKQQEQSVICAFPANPATLKEFVGRTEVLDQLWNWLLTDDEPRAFLFGKGGSGKSTIAYEFAKMVSENAKNSTARHGTTFDAVLYLTAKRRALDTKSAEITEFLGCDFSDSRELFEHILILSSWFNEFETVQDFDETELENAQLLENVRIFMVIDDIDTLTINKLDPGMDTLYRLLVRSEGSQILYTLRNLPSHSLKNSIEVPSLSLEGEYQEFIAKCCDQFGVPEPSERLASGQICEMSERRPLLLETIIGLRRSCASYEHALELLGLRAGENVRAYLFEREYDHLEQSNRARYLLAALSLFEKPVAVADLEVVLKFDPQQMADAVGEVNEMFLTTSLDERSGDSLYGLGQATKAYIESQREKLDKYPVLKELIQNYRKTFHPKRKEIARLRLRVDRYLFQNDPAAALGVVEDIKDVKVTQHPEYLMLLGRVAARLSPPDIPKAREAFSLGFSMGHADADALRAWYYMEWTSGFGLREAIRICEQVISEEKKYSQALRAEFWSKKGYALLRLARNEFDANQRNG